ncbi:MAG TPA: transposase, partial [Richelia sp.]|nr:transposase [Richelia sp.]
MRKLTDSDKQEILKLYRESAETTSTLAERYEVSNSTISRLLKSTLPEDEYEYLVSLKRAARTPGGRAQVNYENIPAFANQEPEEKVKPEPIRAKPSRLSNHSSLSQLNKSDANLHINEKDFSSETRRIRRRSSAVETIDCSNEQLEILESETIDCSNEQLEILESETIDCSNEQLEILEPETIEVKDFPNQLSDDEDEHFKTQVIAEMLGEELLEDDEDD